MDHAASYRKDGGVPNLSSQRQHDALVALGNAIRDARVAKNLSQEQLALQAGIDPSYLGRVERGDNNVATLSIVRIAAALGLSVAHLFKKAGL